jgi:hypothetical protein
MNDIGKSLRNAIPDSDQSPRVAKAPFKIFTGHAKEKSRCRDSHHPSR